MTVNAERRAEAEKMRDAGASLRDISAATGISKGTLSYWFSPKTRDSVRERNAARRKANLAAGLTSKGKPRQPRREPAPRATSPRRRRAPKPPRATPRRPRPPAKPPRTLYERHGVLSFARPEKGSSRHICRLHKKGTASAPWRMAICGWPALDDRGEALRLCSRCMKRWMREWDTALGYDLKDLEEQAA